MTKILTRTFLSAMAGLFLFPAVCDAVEGSSSDSSTPRFTFLQFSDVHVGHPVNRPVHERLRAAVRLANAFRPAFIIDSGDMTNNPVYEATAANLAEFAEYKRYMVPLEMPLYFVPGNHDIGYFDPGATQRSGKPWGGYRALVAAYEKEMGPLDQAFEHKGFRFILVNNTPARSGGPGFISEKQLKWIERQMKSSQRTFVFCHVPVLAEETWGPWGNSAERLVKLCMKHGVAAVGYGHSHKRYVKEIAGTQYIMCPDLKVPGHQSILEYRVLADRFDLRLIDVFSRQVMPVGSYRYPEKETTRFTREVAPASSALGSPCRVPTE